MEPAEIGQIFQQMAAGLVLYARQFLASAAPEAAEDVVQEVFIRLAAQPAAPPNTKAWLLLAVRRAALDAAKSNRRRTARDRRAGHTRQFQAADDSFISAQEVQEALTQLALEEREIVTLKIWNDATFEEIAGIMKLPLSSVYQRYRTALETLRAKWEVPCPRK